MHDRQHAAVARKLRGGQIEDVQPARWLILCEKRVEGVRDEKIEPSVPIKIEPIRGDAHGVFVESRFMRGVHKLGAARFAKEILQQHTVAVSKGQIEILV